MIPSSYMLLTVLLGIQVFIGVAALFIASYLGRKAFSDDIYRSAGDRTFSRYLLGCFVLLCLSTLLLLTIGVTFNLVVN